MIKRKMIAVGGILGLASTSTLSHGHDVKGIIVQEINSASPEIARALSTTPTSDLATRSVLNNLRLWPVPRKLTICFLSGSQKLRKRVADSMQRVWNLADLTEGRLTFDLVSFQKVDDCGANPSADIRVGFTSGDGYWSYVGIESRNHAQSMNLEGFTESTPNDTELDRLVGHETGHALGLEHEHQSPVAPDCGWNFSYISTHYQWKSDADMHYNFHKLTDYIKNGRHEYIFSTYNPPSLMHYDFEPAAFLDGERSMCFIKRNYAPSDQDKNAFRVAYGPNAVGEQNRTRDALPAISAAFPATQYKQLGQLLAAKAALLP